MDQIVGIWPGQGKTQIGLTTEPPAIPAGGFFHAISRHRCSIHVSIPANIQPPGPGQPGTPQP